MDSETLLRNVKNSKLKLLLACPQTRNISPLKCHIVNGLGYHGNSESNGRKVEEEKMKQDKFSFINSFFKK